MFYKISYKMLHSKLLIVIVLSLAVQICRTGDQSDETDDEEINYIYEDPYTEYDVTDPKVLKCNCLLKALTHMRLTRMSFSLQNIAENLILGLVIGSNGKEMLSILYNLDGVKIGSLWLFHLYIGLLRTFFVKYLNKEHEGPGDVGKKLFYLHSYVTELMASDWNATGCLSYDLNNWYDKWFVENRFAEWPEIKEIVRRNNQEFIYLVEKKKKLMNANEKEVNEKLSESLKMNHLFLNDLGYEVMDKMSLMTSYDVGVDWQSSDEKLKLSYQLVFDLTWPTNHLQYIKLYYTTHIDFLKIIIFRITLKHVLYIELLKDVEIKMKYARQWHTLLTYFGKMLYIEDDLHIKLLLKNVDRFAEGKTNAIAVLDGLEQILHECSLLLTCNANKPITFNKEIVRSQLETASSFKDLGTQKIAHRFMNDLRVLFRGVNFGVIRSLIDYIDELNLMLNGN